MTAGRAPNRRISNGAERQTESPHSRVGFGENGIRPELAEIGNLHYFRREVDSFVAAALRQRSAEISAPHARDILKLIAACYESSANAGQEVPLN
jgi:hypothetical protein